MHIHIFACADLKILFVMVSKVSKLININMKLTDSTDIFLLPIESTFRKSLITDSFKSLLTCLREL